VLSLLNSCKASFLGMLFLFLLCFFNQKSEDVAELSAEVLSFSSSSAAGALQSTSWAYTRFWKTKGASTLCWSTARGATCSS